MFASSAIAADPRLAGKLVAVGSPPPRGIITAATYPVRQFGVKAAMPTVQALRLCPGLILVPPDRALYRRMQQRMAVVVDRFFPVSAWSSIDEFYADATDLQAAHPDPEALGRAVKAALFEATGLRCTLAVAANKTVAKIAADCHKPDGLAVVPPGSEAAFLSARPARLLPGVGPKTAVELDRMGVRTIGDLLDPRKEALLRAFWGRRLAGIQALARGEDPDPVDPGREAKSLSHETTFDEDTRDPALLERTLRGFLATLAHELRQEGLAAGACTVKLKDAAFAVTTRRRRFPRPLNYDPDMWRHIQPALQSLIVPATRYRLAGLGLSDLTPAGGGLFDERTSRAVAAMDAVIARHGSRVMRLGGQ